MLLNIIKSFILDKPQIKDTKNYKEIWEKEKNYLYDEYANYLIEKENICPYCKKPLEQRKNQLCPYCNKRIFLTCIGLDKNHKAIMANIKLENDNKYIKTKNFIDYLYTDIFDFNLSLFKEVKEGLEIKTKCHNIPLHKIVWEKLQADEFDVSCQKQMPNSERLELLGKIYSQRGAVMDFIDNEKSAFELSLQALHYQISCGADCVGTKFNMKQYIKQNNISQDDFKKIYLEQEKQNKGCGGIYEITPYKRTLSKIIDYIYG